MQYFRQCPIFWRSVHVAGWRWIVHFHENGAASLFLLLQNERFFAYRMEYSRHAIYFLHFSPSFNLYCNYEQEAILFNVFILLENVSFRRYYCFALISNGDTSRRKSPLGRSSRGL